MKKITIILIGFTLFFSIPTAMAQDAGYLEKIAVLKKQKDNVTEQEKGILKIEIEEINKRMKKGEITVEKAEELKMEAAKKRALNIENRLAIIDNKISLLERNKDNTIENDSLQALSLIEINWGGEDRSGNRLFGVRFEDRANRRNNKYDRRTYSDLILAVGFNNALIEGESLGDSPYRFGGSRFFEIGWQWRTRVFENTNFLRFHYGFSFQFNGLKPYNNQFFVDNGDQTELQEFDLELNKSKLRNDNLVFPIHFELGPSKLRETDNTIRYSLRKQFRFGIGAYGGFNIGTRQKLRFDLDGESVKEKSKRDFNTSDLIYGLSAYTGIGGALLYLKYDLNPIFKDAPVKQRNISLGVRFDL